MKRASLVAVLATIALAPPASAAPIAIRHDRDATSIALAGADVLVMSESVRHGTRVVALPRTGGKARTLLRVPHAALTFDEGALAASAQRVAVMVVLDAGKTHGNEYRVYSGPPSGPLRLVRRAFDVNVGAYVPLLVGVDGDRMLLVEGVDEASDDDSGEDTPIPLRASILDASGWTPIPWASGSRAPVAIAGPYAAVATLNPRQFQVADFATGAPVATLPGTWQEREGATVDLAADGRIAAALADGIETAGPALPARTLPGSKALTFPHFAGSSLAAFDDTNHRLDLIGASGKPRPLGPPSLVHTDLEADERGVAWLFNGCVRYAPFGAPAKGGDACPASEVALWTIGPSSKLRGDSATAQIKCVASASGRCRGRLIARSDIGKPTVAKFRREHRGSAVINAIVRDGSVGAGAGYSSEFGIDVG